MRRWFQSRPMRKLARHRPAVVALVVIAGYALVAVAVGLFGLIDEERTFERVAGQSVPGFSQPRAPEKQFEDCKLYLETVDRALKRKDPQAALAKVHFGQLRLADRPVAAVRELADHGFELVEELEESENLNAASEPPENLTELGKVVAELFPEPTGAAGFWRQVEMLLGTDRQGRSIALRSIYSIQVAVRIGMLVALISVTIGSLLGAAAGYFGGWVDYVVTWIFTTFSSIPDIVLLVLLAAMFMGTVFEGTLVPLYIAFSATYWIGPCRVIRGETLKIKELEYVQAATAVGLGRFYILLRHVLPNVSHLMLISFSLLFIAAIKGEVILTYLGLGIKNGTSWGIMIEQSRDEVLNGFFWQIGAATALMFGLVLAFNVLSDALQDAFDPKHA